MEVREESAKQPRPLMLDSNIFDLLTETDERHDRVLGLVKIGALDLVTTHIQLDEIERTPDPQKRERLQALPVRLVATAGMVWGLSRWGQARWGGEEGIEAIRLGNRTHTEDALIGTTAKAENCILVTNDDLLAKRATQIGAEVWRPSDLLDHLDTL